MYVDLQESNRCDAMSSHPDNDARYMSDEELEYEVAQQKPAYKAKRKKLEAEQKTTGEHYTLQKIRFSMLLEDEVRKTSEMIELERRKAVSAKP